MEQILIKDKKYAGEYIAIKDFNDPTVISHGDNPQKIYDEAIKKGHCDPVILFVPSKNMVQIYAIFRYSIY